MVVYVGRVETERQETLSSLRPPSGTCPFGPSPSYSTYLVLEALEMYTLYTLVNGMGTTLQIY